MSTLVQAVRSSLLHSPEVTRLTSVRRFNCLFSQGQHAEALFVIEEGLVKQTRTNQGGDRIILAMCGPGDVVGEEALGGAKHLWRRRRSSGPCQLVPDSEGNAQPDASSGCGVCESTNRLSPEAAPDAGGEGGVAVPARRGVQNPVLPRGTVKSGATGNRLNRLSRAYYTI